jgi:vesicle coat complex subunit
LLLFVLQTLHRLEKSSHSEASLRYFAHVAELSKQWRQALYYQTLALRLSSPQESTDLLARRAMVLYQQGNVSLANATMNQAFRAIETYHWSTIPKHNLEDTLRIAKQFFHALSDLDAVNQVVGLEMQIAN